MTRLFRVEEDGRLNEVETNERLAGVYDAILIAEHTGDGKYVYDYQNGQYQELAVVGNKSQQFAPDAIKEGAPSVEYDRSRMQEEVSGSLSRVGGTIFPSDGIVGHTFSDDRPAVEEF